MSIKYWSMGLQKHTKMVVHYSHIRSTDHFKQVGGCEK